MNQPVTRVPSMDLVVLRPHEAGMVGHVGGAADVVLVAAHQMAVPGGDDVLFHDVGAQIEGELIGADGVFGAVAAGTPVADDGGYRQRTRPGAPGPARRDGLGGQRAHRADRPGGGRRAEQGAAGGGGAPGGPVRVPCLARPRADSHERSSRRSAPSFGTVWLLARCRPGGVPIVGRR